MVIRIFGNKIGELLGEERGQTCGEDSICCNFYPGYLLDTGISFVKYIRKFLIGGAIISANSRAHSVKCDQVCRASELPIYINDCKEEAAMAKGYCACPPKRGPAEGFFGSIRQSIWGIYDRFQQYQRDIEDCMRQSSDMSSSMYKYLSEECDDTTRAGAIGVGALTGFILGIRGGIIRRLLFSGIGAYGMSAVCYPEKTAAVTQEALGHSKKYAVIAYNFINGDTRTEPIPKVSKVRNPNLVIQESHAQSSNSCDCDDIGRHHDLYPKINKIP